MNNKVIKIRRGGRLLKIIDKIIEKIKEWGFWLFENKKRYSDLAPVDNGGEKNEAIIAMNWAINNPRVYNIALTGPYGAGKSSIINAYLKKYYRNTWYRNKKVIRISLATFDNKNEPINKNELEVGILKQLFYKVNSSKIPNSRYRKLHSTNIIAIILKIIMYVMTIASIAYLYKPEIIEQIIDKVWNPQLSFKDLSYEIIALFVSILGISYFITYLKSKVKLKELSFGNFSAKTEEAVNESIFDKNVDEILYFFEKTRFQLVIIEDLDRFNNPDVFTQLRELNNLINNSDCVKQRVKFIYALKDDLFKSNVERTKFFDFIVPVIPVINKTNSGQKLIELLNIETKDFDGNLNTNISSEFITNVSPFISDMRVLRNIVNEFWVYKRTLKDSKDVNLIDEKMFSLMIYKNIYPEDFAKLESESGNVKEAFRKKSEIIFEQKEKLERLKKVLLEKEGRGVASEKEAFSEKELRKLILGELSNDLWYVRIDGYILNRNDLLEEKFDFMDLFNKSIRVVSYKSDEKNYHAGKFGKSEYLCQLFDRYENLKIKNNKTKEHIMEMIEEIENNLITIRELSLSKLIEQYGKNNVLPPNVLNNELLVFLLRHGYIDESYAQYINYFYSGSITEEELNFILSVRNYDGTDNKELDIQHTENVLSRLFSYEFKQTEALNYNLTDTILNNKEYLKYLDCLIEQLVNRSDVSKRYIEEYLDRNKNIELFILKLCDSSSHIWEDLYSDETILQEKKELYFENIIKYADIEGIVRNNYEITENKQEKKYGISEYIKQDEFILGRLEFPDEKIMQVLKELDIVLYKSNLTYISFDLLMYIIDYRHYSLNIYMLSQICTLLDEDCEKDIKNKNYSCIKKISKTQILEYIDDNLEEYIKDNILLESNIDETYESINELLYKLNGENNELVCKIIEHEKNAYWNEIEECVQDYNEEGKLEIWNYVLLLDRTKSSWKNLVVYYNEFNLSSELIQFLERNLDSLFESKMADNVDENILLELLKSDISDGFFERLLSLQKVQIEEIGSDFDYNKVQILVDKKYLLFTSNMFKEVKNIDVKTAIRFALNNINDFFDTIDDCDIDIEIIMYLLKNEQLSKERILKLLSFIDVVDIDEKLALVLRQYQFPLPKEYVIGAFEIMNISDRYELLYNQLEVFDLVELPNLFAKLDDDYQAFANREKQHKYNLYYNEYNQKLCKKLLEMRYLTSIKIVVDKGESRIIGNVRQANKV